MNPGYIVNMHLFLKNNPLLHVHLAGKNYDQS